MCSAVACFLVQVSKQLKEQQCQRMTGPPGRGERGGFTGSGSEGGRGGGGEIKDPSSAKRSEALLSCPACMTTVCMDCQQ